MTHFISRTFELNIKNAQQQLLVQRIKSEFEESIDSLPCVLTFVEAEIPSSFRKAQIVLTETLPIGLKLAKLLTTKTIKGIAEFVLKGLPTAVEAFLVDLVKGISEELKENPGAPPRTEAKVDGAEANDESLLGEIKKAHAIIEEALKPQSEQVAQLFGWGKIKHKAVEVQVSGRLNFAQNTLHVSDCRLDIFAPDGGMLLTERSAEIAEVVVEGKDTLDATSSFRFQKMKESLSNATEASTIIVKGRLWNSKGPGISNTEFAIYAPPEIPAGHDCSEELLNEDCCCVEPKPITIAPSALAISKTDENGYFEFSHAKCSFSQSYVVLQVRGLESTVAVKLTPANEAGKFQFGEHLLIPIEHQLIVASEKSQWLDETKSCEDCDRSRFDKPDRVIEEFSSTFIIRTSDPHIELVNHDDLDSQSKSDNKQSVDDRFRREASSENRIEWDKKAKLAEAVTIAHGRILTVKQQWRNDGYSLGDLLYSLPLAPLQKKNIAIYDWTKTSTSSRDESTTQSEQLSNLFDRDRDVSQVVNSALNESVSARSESGSRGGSRSSGLLGGLFGGGSSGSSSAWSTASQNSSRTLASSLVNNLKDRISQSATSFRSQHITVVTQQTESETSTVVTETVANRNACHALTIQYFEVLRHFAIGFDIASVQECLFVPLPYSAIDASFLDRWSDSLEKVALSDEIAEAIAKRSGRIGNADDVELRFDLRFEFVLPVEVLDEKYAGATPTAYKSGTTELLPNLWVTCASLDKSSREQFFHTEIASALCREFLDGLTVKAHQQAVTFSVSQANLSSKTKAFVVSARFPKSDGLPRLDLEFKHSIPGQTRIRVADLVLTTGTERWEQRAEAFTASQLQISLNDAKPLRSRIELDELGILKHLREHAEYYHKAVWATMDPDRRFAMLDGFMAPGSSGRSVASVVENRLAGIIGNSLVLPVSPGLRLDPFSEIKQKGQQEPDDDIDDKRHHEDLTSFYRAGLPEISARVSLPTKGVFAEAILGNCNSCERTDDSRNWKYWEHELPDQPAAINSIAIRQPSSTLASTSPTPMQAPIINQIQNSVPADPDTSALTAALNAITKSDPFRSETGLAGTQQNAAAALKESFASTNQMNEIVGGLVSKAVDAAAAYYTSGASSIKGAISKDAAAGRISKEQAQSSISKVNDLLTETLLPGKAQAVLENPDVSAVLNNAAMKGAPVTVRKGDTEIDVGGSQSEQAAPAKRSWWSRLFMPNAEAAAPTNSRSVSPTKKSYFIEIQRRTSDTGTLIFEGIRATCWWDPTNRIEAGTYTGCSKTKMAKNKHKAIYMPDAKSKKTGANEIFIHHGSDPGSSWGCIAVEKEKFQKIWDSIEPVNGNITVHIKDL